MKKFHRSTRTFLSGAIVAACLPITAVAAATPAPADVAAASNKALTAEWWQWATSIPAESNPVLDQSGASCGVGQRGDTWFLAGVLGSGTLTRNCTLPAGKTLFFPAINALGVDTPNICGQGASLSLRELRDGTAAIIDGARVQVLIDGVAVKDVSRVKSKVFEVTFPDSNIFSEVCAPAGGQPAGVFSPAIDDGIYAKVSPLAPGNHTVRFVAENPAFGIALDVTYNLTVVPVKN